MISTVGFFVLAGLVTLTSLFVVAVRNLVHAVFWLAAMLIASAGLMVWLDAPFIAGVQIVLYTGGVMTLMLIAVMLTNRTTTTFIPNPVQRPGAAALAALTLLGIFVSAIWNTPELAPEVVAARSVSAMRSFDADLLIEIPLEEPVPEEVPDAPTDDEESTSQVPYDLPSIDEVRSAELDALRERLAQPLAALDATEVSVNDDDGRPIARMWLALADRSPVARREAARSIEALGLRVVELDVTAQVGRQLLSTHVLAFVVLSVLLLAAMLGAIVLARRKDP